MDKVRIIKTDLTESEGLTVDYAGFVVLGADSWLSYYTRIQCTYLCMLCCHLAFMKDSARVETSDQKLFFIICFYFLGLKKISTQTYCVYIIQEIIWV